MADSLMTSYGLISLREKLPGNLRERGVSLEFRRAVIGLLLITPLYALVLKSDGLYFSLELALGLGLLLGLALRRWKRRREGWILVSVFLGAALFQNLILGIFLGFGVPGSAFPVLVLIELKTLLLYGGAFLLTVFSLRRKRMNLLEVLGGKAGVLFVAWMLLSLLVSPASWFSKIAYLRSFLAAFAGWQLGKLSVRRVLDFDRSIGVFLVMGIFVALFSAVEFFSPDIWTNQLHLGVLTAVKGPVSNITDFFGVIGHRLFTAIGTPINAGFIVGAMLLFAWSLNRRRLTLAFLSELVLTFAKSGMLATLVGGAVLFGVKRKIRSAEFRRYALYGVLGAGALVVLYLKYLGVSLSDITTTEMQANTAVGHVVGLVTSMQDLVLHPFGRGLGMGGNWTSVGQIVGFTARTRQSATAFLFHGSESDVGALLYQLGIVGLAAFLAWCGARFRELIAVYNSLRISFPVHARLALAALGICLGVLIASLFTEAAYSPQVSGLVFMFGGLAVGLGSVVGLNRPPGAGLPSEGNRTAIPGRKEEA
jgi:hypothetical protein